MSDDAGGLSWTHRVADIRAQGLKVAKAATPAERASLAEALDVLAVEGLEVRYTLSPSGRRRYRLAGDLSADVKQCCVVTLEPLRSHIEETFRVEFCPPEDVQPAEDAEQEILKDVDVEPLDGDVIDAGRIVFELLSGGLDPYPRKDGSEFSWSDPVAEASRASGGAFAALKKLKDQG